jgi:glucose-1-phosphate cytidylyltransferase
MKTVILAGGLGTRISEESHLKPKPMIEIGGKPILWHIMKCYGAHGLNEFVICCGYKGYLIKEYFANYFLHTSDVTLDLSSNEMQVHNRSGESWKVTIIDTGERTQTGGRIRRVREFIDGPFCLTYGDGVADVDLGKLIEFHEKQGRSATVTGVQPEARFGALAIDGARVLKFSEKPAGDGRWVNGGFFVCQPDVFDIIEDDDSIWEREPLEHLAQNEQLAVHKHHGFWSAMDTLRDREYLERLWSTDKAPWKTWE